MTKSVDTLKKAQEGSPLPKANDINIRLSCKIELLFKELEINLDDYTITDEYIRGPAPCHGGTNHTSFIYYHSSGCWYCWSHHCHETYGKNGVGLIRAVKNLSFTAALKKAYRFLNKNQVDDTHIQKMAEERERLAKLKKQNYWKDHNEPIRTFDESIIKKMNSAKTFAEWRSLDVNLFAKYGIGYSVHGKLMGRIVVPIRNVRGKIVGFTGRAISPKDNEAKWLHAPAGTSKNDFKDKFRTGVHLFNIDNAFRYNSIHGSSEYIITEGPFDVIKMEMANVHNSVCIFGNCISDGQVEVLRQIGAIKILVAFDGDAPGITGAETAKQKLEKKMFDVTIIKLQEAYPKWDTIRLGGLDWANKNVGIQYIPKIIERLK